MAQMRGTERTDHRQDVRGAHQWITRRDTTGRSIAQLATVRFRRNTGQRAGGDPDFLYLGRVFVLARTGRNRSARGWCTRQTDHSGADRACFMYDGLCTKRDYKRDPQWMDPP